MKKVARIVLGMAVMAMAAISAQAQLLWKVSGKDAKGTSYIFGTHHIAPKAMMDSVKGLHDAIKAADKTYGEIDMALMSTPDAQQKMMGSLQALADSTLSKVMTKAQLDSVDVLLKDLTGGQASIAMMEPMKPSILNMQLVMLENMKLFPGFNPQEQLDAMVQDEARAAGKAIGSFETMEEQIDLLYNKPITTQVKELMETVRDFKTEAEDTRKLANAYSTQNMDEMTEMFDKQYKENPEELEELLYKRNDNWLKIIKAQMPQETMFICVGAGHLVGDRGLLKQLSNAGYTVEPVK